MRRLTVCLSGAFGFGILGAYILDIAMYILVLFATIAMIFVICAYLYGFHNYLKNILLIICASALGGMCFGLNELDVDHLTHQEGQIVKLQGVVTELDFRDESCSLVIKNRDTKALLKYYGDCEYLKNCKGSSIEVTGVVELPQKRRNPKCFDYRLYLRTCGIQVIIKAEKIRIIQGRAIPYLKMTGKLRNTFREKLERCVDASQQGIIMGILFGDKTLLDEKLYSDFQRNGTAHVLAVSGLHTGIIYAFFVFLWKWKKGSVFYIIVFSVLLFYMSLADFSPSVVRASCMIFLHLIAELFRCRYDLLTASGLTFTAMLWHNPYQLFNTGFQLSFLAVVSLAVIIPFIEKYYQGIFLSAIAIQAGMVPYTALIFNYVSVGSILANIPVIFIAGIMLPIGVCAMISMLVPGRIFDFFIKMMEICSEMLIKVNDFFYVSGKTSFDVISPPVWLLIVYYGTLFFVLSETGQLIIVRRDFKKIATAAAGIGLVAMISIPVMSEPFDEAVIVFVDVGQGDCMHIKTASGKNYLIDGGGSTEYDVGQKVLKPYLLKNGVRKIDAAFVTHLHEDHYGGIKSLADEGMIEMTAVYEANKLIETEIQEELNSQIVYLHRGYSINLDDDVSIEVISPGGESEETYKKIINNENDENKLSLIMKVKYKGKTLLVTGDIDEDGEADLVEKYGRELNSDVVKVPHHGSKYSSSPDFIDSMQPALAVFQVGRNNYGHPSEAVIGRYKERGCEIARNDISGAIGLIIDDDKSFKVIKMFN